MRNFGIRWLGGIPGGASGKEPACQCRGCERRGFDPWVGKIPWRRAWQPALVISPRKSHGERWGYSFRGVTKGQTRLKQLRHTHPTWLGAPATDTPGAVGHLHFLPYRRVDSPLKNADCSQACFLRAQICCRALLLLTLTFGVLSLHKPLTASSVHQQKSGWALFFRNPGLEFCLGGETSQVKLTFRGFSDNFSSS